MERARTVCIMITEMEKTDDACLASNDSRIQFLRGRDMLCFSHDWTGDPLSKTHLMRLMSRDNRILWVNSIGYRTPRLTSAYDMSRAVAKLRSFASPMREVERNIFVLNPVSFPLFGPVGAAVNAKLLRFQIRHAMRSLGFRRPINWIFNPAAAVIAGELGEQLVIYYCVDEFTAFNGVHSDKLKRLEAKLLRRADHVFVSSEKLRAAKATACSRITLVRHGVDYELFRTALDDSTIIPDDIRTLPRPIIGYFGLMGSEWLDQNLLVQVARSFPEASLVLLGRVTMDVSLLRELPNVHFLGRKPYHQLPAYCRTFDVGLIPFPINEVTLNSNPLKAREYLAAGVPVVSTAIPEVEVLNQCKVATDDSSFVRFVGEMLGNSGDRRARSAAMAMESWTERLILIDESLRGHADNHS